MYSTCGQGRTEIGLGEQPSDIKRAGLPSSLVNFILPTHRHSKYSKSPITEIAIMSLEPSHPDYWTEALAFTETLHRDVYPAIDPSRDNIRSIAKDKVVLVTGAGSGFGEVTKLISS